MKKEHQEDKKKKGSAKGGSSTDQPTTTDAAQQEREAAAGGTREQVLSDPSVFQDASNGPEEAKDHQVDTPVPEQEGSTEELLKTIEHTKAELEQLRDTYIRLLADFDNYKKRMSREKADLIQFGNESLLRDVLPIIDNIERLKTYCTSESDWEALTKGVDLIVQEIRKLLARYDVQLIDAVGKPFDPARHEVIKKIETTEITPNTVIEEFQKGYTFRGRLLRPSVVSVAVQPQRNGYEVPSPGNITGNQAEGDGGSEPIIN